MPWLFLLQALVLMVVGELLRPKPKMEKLKPSALSDFTFPTSDPSRAIGLFRGTCKLSGPNVTWFGDYKSVKRTKRVKTGLFSHDTIDLGFNYYLGFQAVFALGDPSLVVTDVFVGEDEKSVKNGSFTDNGDYYSMLMDSPEILNANGDLKEGVKGPIKIYKGTATQPVNAYLDAKLPEPQTSAFRRVFYMVAEQCYLGNSDTPPVLGLIARCCPNPLGLTGGKENVNGDYNLASFVYEIYTENVMWGLGVDPSEMDIDSFIECAETLYDEGIGVSMTFDESVRGRDMVDEILRHGDGVVFRDPLTNKWTMKLARDDYVVEDLPLFGNDQIDDSTWSFSRTSYDETRNITIVNYTDRSKNFTVVPTEYKNPANIFARGGTIDSETYDFLGISNATTAETINRRVNRTVSNPLARIEFSCKRGVGSGLRPGDVLRVTKPDRGITGELIMRVLKVTYGTMEDPAVKLVLLEDIYAKNHTAFGPPEDTGWEPLYELVDNLLNPRIVEVPYEMLGHEARHFMALAPRGDQITEGFEIWSAKSGEEFYRTTGEGKSTIALGGILADVGGGSVDDAVYGGSGFSAVDLSGSIHCQNLADMDTLESVEDTEWRQGVNLLMVNNEIMAWKTITDNGDGTFTIDGLIRGLYHTIMTTHDADGYVYFIDGSVPLVDRVPMPTDDTRLVKLQPYARGSFRDFDDCPQIIVESTRSLASRPNPPGKIRVNGGRFGFETIMPLADWVSLSWQDRNKTLNRVVTQDEEIEGEFGVLAWLKISDLDDDIDPETGQPPIIFSAEHIRSPATFKLVDKPYAFGLRHVRVELGAIDFDGQLSLNHWVMNMDVTTSYGAEDSFHVIYDEAFDPAEHIEEITSLDGVLIFDCSLSEQFRVSLNEDVTEVQIINIPDHKIIVAEFLNYGAYTVTGWPNSVMWVTGFEYEASITGTSTLPKRDLVGLETKTAGVLWVGRVSQDETNEAGVPEEGVFSATCAPNPAYGYAPGGTISIGVAVSTVNGVGPFTYDWQRAPGGLGDWASSTGNIGGGDFDVSDATISSPTFSRTSTNTEGSVEQNWLCTVFDTTSGKTAKVIVEIALQDDGIEPGGTGGPQCVHEDSFLPGLAAEDPARRARNVGYGDSMWVVDPRTGCEYLALCTYAETFMEPGFRVITESGVTLVCSNTAELAALENGRVRKTVTTDLLGKQTYVKVGGVWRWSEVIELQDMGMIPVRYFTCENNYFPVGEKPEEYMAHHNIKNRPNPFEGEI